MQIMLPLRVPVHVHVLHSITQLYCKVSDNACSSHNTPLCVTCVVGCPREHIPRTRQSLHGQTNQLLVSQGNRIGMWQVTPLKMPHTSPRTTRIRDNPCRIILDTLYSNIQFPEHLDKHFLGHHLSSIGKQVLPCHQQQVSLPLLKQCSRCNLASHQVCACDGCVATRYGLELLQSAK